MPIDRKKNEDHRKIQKLGEDRTPGTCVRVPINIGIGLIFFSLILKNLSPFLTTFTKGLGQVLMKLISVM